MTEGRSYDGRDLTLSELDTIRRIIDEVNIDALIEDGDLVIQAACENSVIETLARCDLRRLAGYSADIVQQQSGDEGIFALAGLFSKCAQIVLNQAEPRYAEHEEAESFSVIARLFAGDDRENPPE